MTTRTQFAAALLAVALGVGVWLAVRRYRTERDSAISSAVAAHGDSHPTLAGRTHRKAGDPPADAATDDATSEASRSEDPLEDPPPPAVYLQPDAPPLKPKPALRIHVVTPWGNLPYRELGGSLSSGYRALDTEWQLLPLRDNPDGSDEWRVGRCDADGFAPMSGEDLALWTNSGWALHVTSMGCREEVITRAPNPLPETFAVALTAAEGAVRFRGRVRDDRGRPLGNAGVFPASHDFEVPGAKTALDGSFDLLMPAPEDLGAEEVQVFAVAPGYLARGISCHPNGEDGLDITLERDEVHGHFDLRITRSDGSPAGRARAWLFHTGMTWEESMGSREDADSAGTTRRLLPRLTGGLAAEEQTFEIAQDCGPLLEDLVADEQGKIVVPAIRPGQYHIRAAWADPGGECLDPPEEYEFHVHETLDATISVDPPPKTTTLDLRLRTGRSAIGRIEVAANHAWHCDHPEHTHWIRVDDWTWGQVEVRSGVSQRDGRARLTGRFRFDGLPRSACRLRVFTPYHPDVLINLPAVDEAKAEPLDLGTIMVRDARKMVIHLVQEDGSDIPSNWTGSVNLKGVPDAEPTELTGSWSTPSESIMLPTPPGPDASIVVRVEGRDEPVAVVHGPFEFGPGKPVVIKVPVVQPPAAMEEAK